MNHNNLTRNTNYMYNTKNENEQNNNENNNENEIQYNKNIMIIPKSKFAKLKKASSYFDVFIDRNFKNSKEYFDDKGNYIFKKDLLPEKFYHYNKNTNTEYVYKRDEIWKALPNILLEGHIGDPILGKLIADQFLFNTNSFYYPTLPESERINRPNEEYIPGPSKKQLKKTRKQNREIGLNKYTFTRYSPFGFTVLSRDELIANFEKDRRKEEIIKLKKELMRENKGNVEALAKAVFNKNKNILRAITEAKKAMANRTKYGKKVFKLPRNILTQRKEKAKQKRKTLKRGQQQQRKEKRKEYNWNYNEENYNGENYNEEN